MPRIDERLHALGLALPPPIQLPIGIVFPFEFVRVVGLAELPFEIPVEIEAEVALF
jgi:hypothetical protein